MDKIIRNMLYVSSTYSRDNIIKRFTECIQEFGIFDFGIITRAINYCTSLDFIDSKTIEFSFGPHNVIFRYKETVDLTEDDISHITILLTSFIISIENSSLYEGLMNKLDNKIISFVGSYDELLVDIEINTQDYKRYNTPFSLIKIVSPATTQGLVSRTIICNDNLNKIKSCIRISDKLYRDNSGIYILLKNTDLEGGKKVVDKIKSEVGSIDAGIATWEDAFVPVDLLSEVENSIYISKIDKPSKKQNVIESLNRIFDRSLLHKDKIYIIESNDKTEEFKIFQCLAFNIDECKYMVLRNPIKDISDYVIYEFNGEDYASDVIHFLKNKKRTI